VSTISAACAAVNPIVNARAPAISVGKECLMLSPFVDSIGSRFDLKENVFYCKEHGKRDFLVEKIRTGICLGRKTLIHYGIKNHF
jgi:hypothetical protein